MDHHFTVESMQKETLNGLGGGGLGVEEYSEALEKESVPEKSSSLVIAGNNHSVRPKRSSLACIRCRTRHIRCPGGNPCKKCQLAKAKCEYVEAEKKIVVLMKYILKLQEDIARLKKDNATLRNSLQERHNLDRVGRSGANIDAITSSGLIIGLSNAQNCPEDPVGTTIPGQFTPEAGVGCNQSSQSLLRFHSMFSMHQSATPSTSSNSIFLEVIHPSLDKHGRLIQSRTGEKLYVGSSSMTLFGLEIENMVPSFSSSNLLSSGLSSPETPGGFSVSSPSTGTPGAHLTHGKGTGHTPLGSSTVGPGSRARNRETKILEKEGNAYKITLAKTNTRPGISINFTLPSYSYAMLLVDTFVNYNDGCFYFFNEGLVKKFLMNLYTGNMEDNKKILKRNINKEFKGVEDEENPIKNDADDETILETIWFCKILLIFATGEMYLGTELTPHIKQRKSVEKAMYERKKKDVGERRGNEDNIPGINRKHSGPLLQGSNSNADKDSNNESNKPPSFQTYHTSGSTLPGAGFFYQASELFTGLFASGAIDNITKDGGIEVMLLYAFYLQVADCTIASYFYFGLALRSTLILGWHVDADKENLNQFELEHRRRIWWTVYMYERMLLLKAGLPLSFTDDSVSTDFPFDVSMKLLDFPKDDKDVRGYYVFPPAEYINNCVVITQINAMILLQLYTKQPTHNILPVVSDLVHKLLNWKSALPEFLKVDFQSDNLKVSRLVVNLMTEYFQGMNLAVRPLLFHFLSTKLQELNNFPNQCSKYIDLSKYLKNVLTLLNTSFQASINLIRCIWALVPENMVALFGWMDREYLFTSALTLILFNASFGVHEATKEHLDHALMIFSKMKRLGNHPAALRRLQLLKLISVLDFNGVMAELLKKHDDEGLYHQLDKEDEEMQDIPENQQGSTDISAMKEEFQNEKISFQSGINTSQNIPLNPIQAHGIIGGDISSMHTDQIIPDRLHHKIPGTDSGIGAERMHNMSSFMDFPDIGNVYSNADLAGIEGLTYLDAEQKLWSDITSAAGWLNIPGGTAIAPGNADADYASAILSNETSNANRFDDDGGYGDIINQDFKSDMDSLGIL